MDTAHDRGFGPYTVHTEEFQGKPRLLALNAWLAAALPLRVVNVINCWLDGLVSEKAAVRYVKNTLLAMGGKLVPPN